MDVSGVTGAVCPIQQTGGPAAGCSSGQTAAAESGTGPREQTDLVELLREEQEEQPTLLEMIKEAREKAEERKNQLKLPKNSQRYGDAAMMAYARLARARTLGDVDAASGYARRQIAQLQSAKRSDSDNAQRIEAAICQLRKAVNRAGKKKRELSQEKLSALRQKRLEKERRTREAQRLRHQLRSRQTQRFIRESGYLREAEIDNRFQEHLSAVRMEMRQQAQELMDRTSTSVESAVSQYAAAEAAPPAEPTISLEA